ncbi:acetylornithine deacetylase [Rudaea sp.]|uniref:acetylornithine deacetylase n=1 Tax=Rudaea sp. TaxID=2136325 RepID=UPI0032202F69
MSDLLASTLKHLHALVAFDTRNPPREIGTGGIFDYLRAHLPGFDCSVTDHGAGAVSLLAVRGKPKVLFNVHLDTVPDSPHWTASPFELRVTDTHAIGLGACDIKGAAAALLTAAAQTHGDAAFLFTTDEEANDARCIAAFLSAFPSPVGRRWREAPDEGAPTESRSNTEPSPQPLSRGKRGFETVIVAEPTRGEAVLAHRGISSVLMRFKGRAGHASGGNAASDSALHQAIRWGQHALDYVESQAHQRFGGLTGLRFNIGRVEGGIKANMIAPGAEVRFGFRPLPSMDIDALLATFRGGFAAQPAEFQETFRGPSLPAGDVAQAEARRLEARDFADEVGLTIGNAVDFWTEASLFSQAGYTAIVCGPGDIAQAHTADEFVELSQLQQITQSYISILNSQTR